MIEKIDRFRGSLLGMASGDALGTTLEFCAPGSFTPINDMIGGGPFDLIAGEWTDDTSMGLCLAESLVECQGFNPRDQMKRYIRWYREGHLSSNGRCFDIGLTTQQALKRFENTGEPFSGSIDPKRAGNGSLMRLAPVALFYSSDPEQAIHYAGESSRTTHGAAAAVDACRFYAGLLVGALGGTGKETLLSSHYCPLPGYWESNSLTREIDEIAQGSFKTRQPPQIKGSGYVVRSLEAALWAFHQAESFRHGCLLAANLGDDADTTCAIYGQLAGAYFGESDIPGEWRQRLALREVIEGFAERLFWISATN